MIVEVSLRRRPVALPAPRREVALALCGDSELLCQRIKAAPAEIEGLTQAELFGLYRRSIR